MQRFEGVHDLLPKGRVFDGEILLLDAGRPLFNELLFGRRRPTYVAFDLLMASGIDLWSLPLREREAALARISRGPIAGLRLLTAWSATGGRCTGPWSTRTSRASSPSVSPTPTDRSMPSGIRSSTAATRSVAAVPKGFASAEDAMPDTG